MSTRIRPFWKKVSTWSHCPREVSIPFQLWGGDYVHHVSLSSPILFRFRRPCSWVWKIIYGTIALKCMNRPLNRIIRHDLGITIDTILTDLQIGVQTALKSGFVYVDGQTRRHSPFSFSIRGRSHKKARE